MDLLATLVRGDAKGVMLLFLKGFSPLLKHLPESQGK